eukprot:PhF_6_TR29808/c0_g1_i1/m.43791/K01069/E3.1.2.6, gloB; hydroxyacylglutathione hydrolase
MSARWSVVPVPVLKDNYCYLLSCAATRVSAVVDVAYSSAPTVIQALQHHNITEFSILSTHKHADHTGGNLDMKRQFPHIQIIGGIHDNIPGVTKPVHDGDEFTIGELMVKVLHTPCHTKGHVLYWVYHPADVENGCVFTGDTVFVAGVGAFFEGDAKDMIKALRKVMALPPNTKLYCGHEYTEGFLKGALTVEPDNVEAIKFRDWVVSQRAQGLPTMGTPVGNEPKYNIYMRALLPELQGKMGTTDEVALLQKIYDMT